ncbi:hypothetical protein BO94DRAFT_535518 [Aspergillus sclerotioniger CBS 115572]|uniref:Uncharacterized protein n=1 Tax=Aspergillus sclerotioniger CBS 115572 TaxID=1450535 RepID=A0A317WJ52_9EURO|nr:hypothetical protein BO94DRAFT_535518 [Aspergillus sclerotioniger CBS 115572]PWY86349.1 hypothetical protein BO94DRAFT_535518 [Aspergillus sclerotioniger CBS 115572]
MGVADPVGARLKHRRPPPETPDYVGTSAADTSAITRQGCLRAQRIDRHAPEIIQE